MAVQRLTNLRAAPYTTEKEDSRTSRLRTNMLSGVATQIINVIVLLISYPIYLHYLGYTLLGIWVLLTTIQTFCQFGLIGIGPALTKLVAECRGKGDHATAQSYFSSATLFNASTGLVVVIGIAAFRHQILSALGLTGDAATKAMPLLFPVSFLTCYSFYIQTLTATLSGWGRIDLANWSAGIAKIASMIVEVTCLSLHVGLVSLVLGDMAICIAQHLFCLRSIKINTKIQVHSLAMPHRYLVKTLLTYGGGMAFASAASLLLAPCSRIILAKSVGVDAVPVFDLAYTGTMQSRNLFEAGLRAMMPAVSTINAMPDANSATLLRTLYNRAFKSTALLALPVYTLVVAMSPPVLKLWLGIRYQARIVSPVQILTISVYFSLLAVPAYHSLLGLGRIRSVFLSHLIAGISNVVIQAFLVCGGVLTLATSAIAILIGTLLSSLYLLIVLNLELIRK
jgi:O-antigen/teichoic acid export membrane protein